MVSKKNKTKAIFLNLEIKFKNTRIIVEINIREGKRRFLLLIDRLLINAESKGRYGAANTKAQERKKINAKIVKDMMEFLIFFFLSNSSNPFAARTAPEKQNKNMILVGTAVEKRGSFNEKIKFERKLSKLKIRTAIELDKKNQKNLLFF